MGKNRSPKLQAKAALKALIAQAGNPSRLAHCLDTTRTRAYAWRVLPEDVLRKAVEVFGGPAEKYRPDLSAFQIAQAMKPPEGPQETATPRLEA